MGRVARYPPRRRREMDLRKRRGLHEEWWKLHRERQKADRRAIARHAETEMLYDQPYEDTNRIRVTGPFTVESLLAASRVSHRRGTAGAPRPQATERTRPADFATMILDNLRKAGVQNTVKNERLNFDRLDPYAGTWISRHGRVHRRQRQARRVAVCHRPRARHRRPRAGQGSRQGGGPGRRLRPADRLRLRLRPARRRGGQALRQADRPARRMNPDLAMGDELLKKTGAGNLFMVFGEPDVDIDTRPTASSSVEIRGVDVYDPTTGEIRISIDRRHRLLVHRHRLQRRELLRPPRLLHRRRRALRQAQARPARRDRRGRLGSPLSTVSRPFPRPKPATRQDRREGH